LFSKRSNARKIRSQSFACPQTILMLGRVGISGATGGTGTRQKFIASQKLGNSQATLRVWPALTQNKVGILSVLLHGHKFQAINKATDQMQDHPNGTAKSRSYWVRGSYKGGEFRGLRNMFINMHIWHAIINFWSATASCVL